MTRTYNIYLSKKNQSSYYYHAYNVNRWIDEARGSVVEDLIYSQMLAKVGWVRGVGQARPSKPRTNLTGDPYFTDGYRTVLIIDQGPLALDQIQTFLWEASETLSIGATLEPKDN